MKKIILIIIAVFNSSLVFCSPIQHKIGVSLPLTGELATYGTATSNGIELARKKYPDKFANIKFIYEDNKYSANQAITSYFKLRAENIDVLYSWGEVPLQSVATIAERDKFPVIAMSLDTTPALKKEFVIRSINSPATYVEKLVHRLRNKGYKSFGVIKVEDPYINAWLDGFRNNLNKDEKLEIFASALPGELDFKTHVLKLRAKKYDAFGVLLQPGQISNFYKQLFSQRIGVPTFGNDNFEDRVEIKNSGSAMQGALYSNFAMPTWFKDEYLSNFNNDNQIAYAYHAYAFALISSEVFNNTDKKIDSLEIINRYKKIKPSSDEISYTYKETPDGDKFFEFDTVVKVINNDSFEDVSEN